MELILIPVIAIITGFFALYGFKQGLKYQYNLQHDIKPVERNIIKEVLDTKKEDKEVKEKESFLKELLVDPRDEI